jgi:hypothetical protein
VREVDQRTARGRDRDVRDDRPLEVEEVRAVDRDARTLAVASARDRHVDAWADRVADLQQ